MYIFVSPAAPQSVLLLRLHHGRMPDSFYGKLNNCDTLKELFPNNVLLNRGALLSLFVLSLIRMSVQLFLLHVGSFMEHIETFNLWSAL